MLLNMAVEQINIKDYMGSEIHTVKAIVLLESLKKYQQLYSCYNNLGIIYDELEDYDRAFQYFNQSLIYLKKTDRRNILEPIALNNIGVAYKNQGKYKKAIEKYKEAQRKNDAYAKDPQFKAVIIDNIAYAKFKMHDTTELPGMFYEALEIRDSLNITSGIVINKLHLAEYYAAYKDTVNALQNANEALELAASSHNFEGLLASLFLLSELEKPEKGIAYLYDYIKVSDSLHMAERNLREKFTRIRFETDELIIKNEQIEQISELQKWIIGICLFLILISGVAILYYYRKQRMYRIRFKALLEEKEKTKTGATTVAALDISEKALNNITEKLKTFIEEKQFLSNAVSLNELAKAMDTNPNYLSRFINFYEQKNFSAYIKDLRINYAVAELKTNAIFRKYSIKAIAEELGFNNEQSFSKAFYKKAGIYPSYFIKELEKEVLRKRSA